MVDETGKSGVSTRRERNRGEEPPAGFPQPTAVGYRGAEMDLSTAYRYNQNMMEYYTCKLMTRALLRNCLFSLSFRYFIWYINFDVYIYIYIVRYVVNYK